MINFENSIPSNYYNSIWIRTVSNYFHSTNHTNTIPNNYYQVDQMEQRTSQLSSCSGTSTYYYCSRSYHIGWCSLIKARIHQPTRDALQVLIGAQQHEVHLLGVGRYSHRVLIICSLLVMRLSYRVCQVSQVELIRHSKYINKNKYLHHYICESMVLPTTTDIN